MDRDLFKFLPSEIIINIFLRFAVRTIAISKCVCKSWLDLLESDEFVKSHLSTSAAATTLAVLTEGISQLFTVFDLEDEIDVDQCHDCRYKFPHRVTIEGSDHGLICVRKNEVNADALYVCNPLTKVNFPHRVTIEGSANGLLFLHTKYMVNFHALYVFNPISREYIELHCPRGVFTSPRATYGFGVSKITGKHKVVCIKYNNDCHVYTLGTRLWRCVEVASASFEYDDCTSGTFVNGNLHWIVYSNATLCISCFDLETECFSTVFVPPFQGITDCECYEGLSVLMDCLCYCDHTSQEGQIVIWLMKEYGDEKSWRKEYVIGNPDFDRYGEVFVYPIKVFKDGSILMVWKEKFLYYYSNKTKTIQKIGVFNGGNNYIIPMLLTPSLLSLKSFPMENVISL